MTIDWCSEDLNRSKAIVFEQGVDRNSYSNTKKPNDIHLVDYYLGGSLFCDAVRAYKMADIFDLYHDRLRAEGDSSRVVRITAGHGDTNPKLHGFQMKEQK